MIRPSDIKVILSKVVFDESDDNELENRKGSANKQQMQLQKNKDYIIELSDKLDDKMDSIGIDCSKSGNTIRFAHDFMRYETPNFENSDKSLRTIENYVEEKTGYSCTIDIYGIKLYYSNPNLDDYYIYEIMRYSEISDYSLSLFDEDNMEIFKKSYKIANEILDDVDQIVKFIYKHIDITIDE